MFESYELIESSRDGCTTLSKAMMKHPTRRKLLQTALSGASVLWAGNRGLAAEADPLVRGPFPILSTPFTETGAVDYEVLADQARFVDWGGLPWHDLAAVGRQRGSFDDG